MQQDNVPFPSSSRRAFRAAMLVYHEIASSMGTIGATNYEQVLGSKAKPPKNAGKEIAEGDPKEPKAGSRSFGHDGINFVADVELAAKRVLAPHLLATFKKEYLQKADAPELHTMQMEEVETILGEAFIKRDMYPVRRYFSKVPV